MATDQLEAATVADAPLDDGTWPAAMRTSAYLVVALLGLGIAASAFLPWAGVPRADGSEYDFASEVVGVDAGGWGEAAIAVGAAIFLLGVLGYFWNPFSDPEALFISVFASLALAGAVLKMMGHLQSRGPRRRILRRRCHHRTRTLATCPRGRPCVGVGSVDSDLATGGRGCRTRLTAAGPQSRVWYSSARISRGERGHFV